MNKTGLSKAKGRLQKSRECVERIRIAQEFETFESAWTDFLLASNSVYSVLEQSVKGHTKAEEWFGRKKHERRIDPLLAYLHQARNTDEHGIEPVAEHDPGGFSIGTRGEHVSIENMVFGPEGLHATIRPVDGKYPTIQIRTPRAVLIHVRNSRFGDVFNPPREHLGKTLDDNSPLSVAELGLAHLEKLVEEAENLH